MISYQINNNQLAPKQSIVRLKEIVDTIESKKHRKLCNIVLNNEQFQVHPASLKKHHTWKGGLAQHTLEVTRIAEHQCQLFNPKFLDRNVLLTACVFHDFGKIYDVGYKSSFVYDTAPKVTDDWDDPNNANLEDLEHKKLIYHVSRSYAEWMIVSGGGFLHEKERIAVGHCILSHHGRLQWKAVQEPRTAEAYILHHADMTSVFVLHGEYDTHEKD